MQPAPSRLRERKPTIQQHNVDWNIASTNGTTGHQVTQSAPAPTKSETTSSCFQWYVDAANDTCALIEESFGLTPQQFIAWNPSLNALCTNFILGDAYCVYGPAISVSSTITSGPTSTTAKATTTTTTTSHSSTTSSSSCTKTYTVASGDTCYIIYTKYALTAAQFMALNPTLNAACALTVGQVVCIAGPTSATSTTHTSTPSATPTSTCTKTYTVVSGDTCYAIYTKLGITDAQLMAWNPSLDAACDLSVGQVSCVAD
ncbi:Glycoside hydrolase 18 protein [Xylographa bjoerkii]|nr:Glycoside hydrolase 18 protein [Xylographa bjoerkii]